MASCGASHDPCPPPPPEHPGLPPCWPSVIEARKSRGTKSGSPNGAVGEVSMNRRIVATLVVALLAVSCTPDQPDGAIGQGGRSAASSDCTKANQKDLHQLRTPWSARSSARMYGLWPGLRFRGLIDGKLRPSLANCGRKNRAGFAISRQSRSSSCHLFNLNPSVSVERKFKPAFRSMEQAGFRGRNLPRYPEREWDRVSIYGIFEDSQYRGHSIRIPVLADCRQ